MQERVVLVTGGSSGIGLGLVKELVHDGGYRVYSMSRRTEAIAVAQASVGADAGRVTFLVGEIESPEHAGDVARRIENECGRLDGLVCAAGTISAGGIESSSLQDWLRVLNVNLTGTFITAQAMVPLLKRGVSPSVVNVSSVCSLRPCASVAYSVSKAGVDMLTKCMAKDLAQYGIRVNSINPGVVRTNLQTSAGIVDDYEEFIARMGPLHPLGRIGEPVDTAALIKFLISPQSEWITGAVVSIDGGRAL